MERISDISDWNAVHTNLGHQRSTQAAPALSPDPVLFAEHNLAFWNEFDRPKVKPKFDEGVIDTWWYDAEKAAKLKKN